MKQPWGKRCNAKSKRTGKRCGDPAMKGRTKCYFHGGKTPRGQESPNYKHGLYSKYAKGIFAERMAEMAAREKELTNLMEMLRLQHAILAEAVSQEKYGSVLKIVDEISRNIERWFKITEGERVNVAQSAPVAFYSGLPPRSRGGSA